jgi:2-keto-4-pentenoate hydratase/2-oxohepta-3-ene-1,7-dioic acid hydratase in catechol pathway
MHTVGREPEPSDVIAIGEAYLQHAEELRQYAEQRKRDFLDEVPRIIEGAESTQRLGRS